MGRGRQKAKQQKIARKLKYLTTDTDYDELAKELGVDYFTTTLSISPYKNAQKLNEISEKLGEIYDVKALPADFKKREGYKRSIQLSSEYGLYRQDYCGCIFSKRERERLNTITTKSE